MRDIRFRVWHPIHGMVYGCVQWHPAEREEWLLPIEEQNLVTHDAIPMQYIGLKDKTGKDIYEGDLMSYRLNAAYPAEVFWDGGRARFMMRVNGEAQVDKYYPVEFAQEVIGNIYENPELLKAVERA